MAEWIPEKSLHRRPRPGSFRIRWLGTACFQIVLPAGPTLILDPFIDDSITAPISSDQVDACDFLLLSHGHWDHVLDAGKLASRFHPQIYCNQATADSLVQHLGVDPARIAVVSWGRRIRQRGFSLEVLRGLHPDPRREYERLSGQPYPDEQMRLDPQAARMKVYRITHGDIRLPPKHGEWIGKFPAGEQLNFVLSPDGGPRVYFAGSYPSAGVIEEARKARADLTLLQVLSGDKLKGHEEETARLAIASGCRIVVPQHHDPLFAGARPTDLTRLEEILAKESSARLQPLTPGAWYGFEEKENRFIPTGGP